MDPIWSGNQAGSLQKKGYGCLTSQWQFVADKPAASFYTLATCLIRHYKASSTSHSPSKISQQMCCVKCISRAKTKANFDFLASDLQLSQLSIGLKLSIIRPKYHKHRSKPTTSIDQSNFSNANLVSAFSKMPSAR